MKDGEKTGKQRREEIWNKITWKIKKYNFLLRAGLLYIQLQCECDGTNYCLCGRDDEE